MAKRSGSAERYVPERGDVVWLRFDPQAGHEQAGLRPAVVLSPRRYNDRAGLFVVVPVTSQVKGYPFEVPLPDDLTVKGVVLADQLKSLDWQARDARYVCSLPEGALKAVLQRASALLTTA